MKYAKARVKCSDALIAELSNFKDFCKGGMETEIVKDFFNEVIEGITDIMSEAHITGELDESGVVFKEFFITVPNVVWSFVKDYVAKHKEGYEDIELFFDEISRVKESSFRR